MTATTSSAYRRIGDDSFVASELTRGPWNPDHQHAGPPTALVCRAIERAAMAHGLTHLARLTANLLRPVLLGEVRVELREDYIGRTAAHYAASLFSGGKEAARFTALMQREVETPTPLGTPGHPLPAAPRRPEDSETMVMPFAGRQLTYADLVENRVAEGRLWDGPCSVWFRLRHPLVDGESPSPYQRVAVAADSGNGISAVLDFARYSFVNCDLTINLLRRPANGSASRRARNSAATAADWPSRRSTTKPDSSAAQRGALRCGCAANQRRARAAPGSARGSGPPRA